MSGASPSLEARQNAFIRLCFQSTPAPEDLATLGAQQDRWLLYRNMVRIRLRKMVHSGLRRSVAAMGEPLFQDLVGRWLEAHPPGTRFIREVVPAFAEFMEQQALPEDIPAYLLDLVRFEATRWEVGYDPTHIPQQVADFVFDQAPLCNPTLRFLETSYAVHEIPMPDSPGSLEAPNRTPTRYAIYRRRDDRIDSRILSERAFTWLVRLSTSEHIVTESIRQLAEERNEVIDAAYVEALGATMATLIEQEAILGASL